MGLIGSLISVARLLMLGWLISELILGQSIADVWLLALATLALMMGYSLWEYQRLLLTQRTAETVQNLIRSRLFDQLANLGPAYFANQRSGEISNAMIEGVEQLEIYFGRYLPQLFVAGITPFVIFSVVAFIDLPVACILLVAALFTLFAPSLFQRWDSKFSLARSKAYRAFASEFLDALQGLVTLKAFGQSKAREQKLAKKAHELFETTMWVMATNSLSRGITDIGITLGAACALSVSAYRVSEGLMSYESLILILLLGVEVFKPLRELRSLMHAGMLAQSAAKQIFRILDAKSTIANNHVEQVKLKDTSISFEGVDFSYPNKQAVDQSHNQRSELGSLVLKNLSFKLDNAEQLGVVGVSGGGKSTILQLLLRFYEPQQGVIKIGGVDIRAIEIEQLRSMFAVVSQNTYIFHGTVRENLALGQENATDKMIQAAARAANADQFITELDDGYDTIVGEQGVRLSGGQRQRIAIARAILRDAPILILDEALSSVDAKNEKQIQSALNKLMQGRTSIVLAHRLGSIIHCDQIVMLAEGCVTENGTHTQLLSMQGKYAALMASQLREKSVNSIHDRPLTADLLEPVNEVEKARVTIRKSNLNSQQNSTEQALAKGNILTGEQHSWREVLAMLFSFAGDYKGRLFLTFFCGVLRVFSFIGVSIFSALAVASVKLGNDYSLWLQLLVASAITAAVAHWFESWVAHDMAFRIL
jgi:ATP-binding cassette subfamily C protein CydCD